MRRFFAFGFFQRIIVCVIILFGSISYSQVLQVEILGGAVVTQGSTVTINAGSSLTFRATNIETGNCGNLHIEDVDLANSVDFDISPNNPKDKIKPASCKGDHYLDFSIQNISSGCGNVSTLVTVKLKGQTDFTFVLELNSSPEIYVLGGSPYTDIFHNDTLTSDENGTFFGDVDEGTSITRYYIVANIGSCTLNVSALSSSNSDFTVFAPYGLPANLASYNYTIIGVTFTAPIAGVGTQRSTIGITNTDNGTFNFDVSAEMFNYSIPGPGGITANFRLWLKTTRGVVQTTSKVSLWEDLGTNSKDAEQLISANQPTYLDEVASNINFNPVIKFENNGSSIEQFLSNSTNGFYSQDIFVVMRPETTMTNASSRNTIFAGIDSGGAGDVTGIGFGDYSTEFTNETLSYNQDIPGGGNFNGAAEISSTYSNTGIINVRNNTAVSPTAQDILYNSNQLTTSTVSNSFTNVNAGAGSQYWIGRNLDVQGSLNGRIAEIFTFADRVPDTDRQKIETYLAIKYGITLGSSNVAQKDYVNSFNTKIWDIVANAGYNYDVAGIGRDSISDLNQKQSKTLNNLNGVTIGLGGIFAKNSDNPNEFESDGDFLVWGNDNGAYTGSNTNTITIGSGITTNLTRIDRKWKIIETTETVGADVETVFVGIPVNAFSGFTKTSNEEYVLIVADNDTFLNADIIDVIPLKLHVNSVGTPILDNNGNQIYKTWYDFHDTKYFTFGKASKLTQNNAVSIASGDYLVGAYDLNLSVDSFTISSWLKTSSNPSTRTFLAKGEKLQVRLNSANKVEVIIDDLVTPKYTSNMAIGDGKWHQVTLVYDSGSLLLYVDGVLDHSVQNVVHPSPNYNHFSVGAVYVDKSNVITPFLGDIDEVYVWDLALSENQIRYLMNQEVEKVTGDFVSGKVIPAVAASNAVASIPWSSLRAYYDFNSFYGTTVEGLTNERYFLRLKYLDKDKTIINTQTIPAPYISANNGTWDSSATWSNNSDQIIPNSLSLDGSTVINWNIVQISHDITSEDRDISLLGLIQTSGTLTIADPVVTSPVENNAGQMLKITHYLELDGVIDLVGESQLIQTEGSIIDADSGGYIERDQQGTANGFNYNYWSSSVGPIGGNISTRGTGVSSTNANYTIAGILNDGTNSDLYQGLLYNAAPNGSGSIPPPGFPRTISTLWLYKFYGPANDYYGWSKINEVSALQAGEGFSMKGTGGSALIPITTKQNYVFKGLPNNGDITLALDKSSGDVERLIGNPYPSAIDAIEFILDNISVAEGGTNANTVINGALYFWDHFGQENTHEVKNYVGGYATYNLTGGAAAISNDSRINNTSDGGSAAVGTKVPGQYIPVNQGFFVSTVLNSQPNDNLGTISSVDGGTIIFKNSQRIYETEGSTTSVFMKSSKGKTVSKIADKMDKKANPIIRITYDSPLGFHRQIVIGANEKASNGFDLGYDAFMIDVNDEDMYWNFDNNKFVIQGISDFNQNNEFAIGLIVKNNGIAKIKLDGIEYVDPKISISIKDELTGVLKNIKLEPFEVNLEPGTYNDRFKLVINQVDTPETIVASKIESSLIAISYNKEQSEIKLHNQNKILIKDVKLFDILGNKIKSKKLNTSTDINFPVLVLKGIYIIKINTELGIQTKKIILE